MPSPRNRSNLVLVQQYTTVDGQYGPTQVWAEFGQFWVSISPNRGREVYSADETESVVTHTIRGDLFDLDDVNAKMRIVYNDTHDYDVHGIRADSRVFQILAVMPDFDHHDDMMIQAKEEGRRYGDLPQ